MPEIIADRFQIRQGFLNIALNTEQAIIEVKKEGTLTITTEKIDRYVYISFSDNSHGISKENMYKLLSPFFTTKDVGKGTGLGLSICYGIVTSHSGRIYAQKEPDKRVIFTVELPLERGKQPSQY